MHFDLKGCPRHPGALTAPGHRRRSVRGEMAYWFSAMAAPGLYQLMGLDDVLKDER